MYPYVRRARLLEIGAHYTATTRSDSGAVPPEVERGTKGERVECVGKGFRSVRRHVEVVRSVGRAAQRTCHGRGGL